jgi:hypothetical protein
MGTHDGVSLKESLRLSDFALNISGQSPDPITQRRKGAKVVDFRGRSQIGRSSGRESFALNISGQNPNPLTQRRKVEKEWHS